jgi:hypothetical protein
MTKTWLIGACPSDDGSEALKATGGKAGSADRLREMLEMSVEEYDRAFTRANVLEQGPWRPRAARQSGAKLKKQVKGHHALVLGRDAWQALGLPSLVMYFETWENFTLVPHPSGKNLIYNVEAMRDKLRKVVRDALSGRG